MRTDEKRRSNIDGTKLMIIISTVLLASAGIIMVLYPLPAEWGTRTVHPPGKPTNPSPGHDETGLLGPTITLSWQPSPMYRGDHNDITDNWLKISTQGPCNSDGGTANIFNAAIGPSTTYQLSGSTLKMGATYYWAVKCEDEEGWGPYSNWKFATNALPVASITSITPSQAREGQEILFVGEGVDNVDSDEITAYKWESDVDQDLSDKKSFSSEELAKPLTPGVHQITFKVMDSNELWSEVTSQCKRNLEITVNTPPSKPAGLEVDGDDITDDGEITTHKLSPRIKWRPSTDPDPEDSVAYYISISAQRTYERSIADDEEISVPEFTVPGVLSYGTLDIYTNVMSKTYYLELYSSDGYKKSEMVTAEFKVVNHPPDAPTISIEPGQPKSNDHIQCKISDNTPTKDVDDDRTQYTYNWYKGGEAQGKLSGKGPEFALIQNKDTGHYERWKVMVTPNDGYINGEDAELEFVIGNVPPIARIKNPHKISAPQYTEDAYYTMEEITFDASESTDYDGDTISEYRWMTNRSESPIGNGKTLKKNLDIPGEHRITLRVTDQNGAISNDTVLIWVEEPPGPILTPEIFADPGPFKMGAKVDEIIIKINNSGTDKVLDLSIVVMNNGNPLAGVPRKKNIEIDPDTSFVMTIDDFEIDSEFIDLKVELSGNNSFGMRLTEESGELNYSKNSWKPLVIAGNSGESGGEKAAWIWDNLWILAIIFGLLFIAFIFIGVFILMRSGSNADEEEDIATPVQAGMAESGAAAGYGPPPPPQPPAPPGYPGMPQFPGFGPMGIGSQMYLPPGMNEGGFPGIPAGQFMPPNQLALPAAPGMGMRMEGGEGQPELIPAPGLMLPMPGMQGFQGMPGIPGFMEGPPGGLQPPYPPQYPGAFPGMPSMPQPYPSGEQGRPELAEIFSEGQAPGETGEESDEKTGGPACSNCGASVEEGWLMCPQCKKRLR